MPASAKIMRFTQQGDTALIYHIPDDWNVDHSLETGAETLEGPGKGGGLITLAVLAGNGPLQNWADVVFKNVNAPAVPAQRSFTVSGQEALYYVEPGVAGGTLDMKFLIIRADAGHIAVCLELTSPKATAEQIAAADAVLDSIRVSPPDTSFGS
jgi:hypothetical protein